MPNKEHLFGRRKFLTMTAGALGGLVTSLVTNGCSPESPSPSQPSSEKLIDLDDHLTRFHDGDEIITKGWPLDGSCAQEILDYEGHCVPEEYRTYRSGGVPKGSRGTVCAHKKEGVRCCGLIRVDITGKGACWMEPASIKRIGKKEEK